MFERSNLENLVTYNEHFLFDKIEENYQNPESIQSPSKVIEKKPVVPSDCVDPFSGSLFDGNTKKCFLDGLKKTRCGSEVDTPCLCDSNKVHLIVKNCTSNFPSFDPFFDSFFDKLCLGLIEPQATCTNIPNPSFETITCEDPYKNYTLSDKAKNCLVSSANGSLCHNSSNLSCLCDSRTFSHDLHLCVEKNSTLQTETSRFLRDLCSIPPSVPGCIQLKKTESIAENIGEKIVMTKMKGIIFSVAGIVMLIALGL
ncbi:hypothetical protein PMAC_001669 [Pneumocystis sp. 'macacae']|nr:hypothetical protein PMAC_001669 [Pneumocystis sp. 'macacae']